jgi:hypothetical protein
VSDSQLFWFHCGRCGALFQAAAGNSEGRICSNCGADPSPGVVEAAVQAANTGVTEPAREDAGTPAAGREKRGTRKHRNRHIMVKLMLGWTLLLALIVFGARKLWHAAPQERGEVISAEEAPVLNAEDHDFLQTAGPLCGQVFEGFLSAGTPEKRNQFVLSPVTTASRMARFYDMNPLVNIKPETLSLSANGLVRLPGGDAFEARWDAKDGRTFDAVFRKESGEWRLDWEHFARYSDYPWALFLAGSGPDEGEFRLLARERLAEERKNEPDISIVLYAPRFGMPAEAGFQSPEFLVSRDTVDGRLLDAAFESARAGRKVFGANMGDINPEGMIRVRVRVRRQEVEMERKFEITGVTACHWYSVDEPGVEPLVRQPPPAEE